MLAGQKCGIGRNCAESTIWLLPLCMMKMYTLYSMIFLNFFPFESLTITFSASPYSCFSMISIADVESHFCLWHRFFFCFYHTCNFLHLCLKYVGFRCI
ncbi:hypothetical protein NC651_016088 [Populus alba x Populus x berolinensis]|nr:hypothetical protein NC651_016088 [Populus alba x Populus x berolinensis]